VFCEIDAATHTLDPAHVEALINERTTGILAVHWWGQACEGRSSAGDFARRHRLPLLFDAAQAFGCTASGRPIGGFGDAEVFSFHATKIVTPSKGARS
jgi:dTDP-4-amino-4,6-dideoxygalactose transaminase